MTLAIGHKPLPVSGQGAETCPYENMREYITITQSPYVPAGQAWIRWEYTDPDMGDGFDRVPEDSVLRYVEHELLANDLADQVPETVTIILHRKVGAC